MPHPLLKVLCPHCNQVTFNAAEGQNPSVETPGTVGQPFPPCSACGGTLSLHDRYTLVEAVGHRTFLALDWQSRPPVPCILQREFPPRSPQNSVLDRLLHLPLHPQWPQVQEYFVHQGLGYLVQEYCSGQTLEQWITTQPSGVSPSTVTIVLDSLLALLTEIHDRGLLHGDLKPANILIPDHHPDKWQKEDLRLVDWGNAQEPATTLPPWMRVDGESSPLASAEYAAPEQLAGQPSFTSDFYSVGVIGIQLLTGIAPFHWLGSGVNWRLFYPGDLHSLPSDLPPRLDRLIDPNPAQRYPSNRPTAQRSSPPTHFPAIHPPAVQAQWRLEATLSGSLGHTAPINALALSPHHPWLASGGDDRTLRLWDFPSGRLLTVFQGHSKPILALLFDPQTPHRLISAGGDGLIQNWDLSSLEQQPETTPSLCQTLTGHQGKVYALVSTTPGHFASAGSDKTIRLWQWGQPRSIATLTGHRLAVQALAFDPIHSYLASGSSDATVKIWDLNTRSSIATLSHHTAAIKAVAFSPDGQFLASAGNDRTILLWDTQSWTLHATLPGHGWPITALCFAATGQELFSSSWDKTIKQWQLQPPQEKASLQDHLDAIYCLFLSIDGRLISGSADRTLKIWKIHAG